MRTQVKNYTFTAGTRQITVTDNISFTKADIAVIVNRTQQKVLFTVPDYNLITDVTNKVITYDNSLPVLAEGDVIWIEIDVSLESQTIVKTEYIDKNLQNFPAFYHDPLVIWEENLSATYPYGFVVLLSKLQSSIALSGSDRYITSDGSVYISNATHTFNHALDDADYTTRWVLFQKADRYPVYSFLLANFTTGVKCIFFKNVDLGNITIQNTLPLFQVLFSNDEPYSIVANHFDGCASIGGFIDISKATSIGAYAFRNTRVGIVDASGCTSISSYAFAGNTSLAEIKLGDIISLDSYTFQSCSQLRDFDLPVSCTTVGNYNWTNCTNLTYANYPNLTSVGIQNWTNCANLTYINCPNLTSVINQNWYGCTNLTTLTVGTLTSWSNNNIQGCTALTKLVIGADTDIALDLRYGVALTADNIRDFIVPNLKDNTGLTAKTITFATAVYNNLVAAGYIALFTAKNWNVAAA